MQSRPAFVANNENPSVRLTGTVQKILPPVDPRIAEKIQIAIIDGELLYRELRLENSFRDKDGRIIRLKVGAEVQITISAKPEDMASPS